MTCCVGILVRRDLVLAADWRSNAGVDHTATVRKLALFERPGEWAIVLLSAGNLATTQAVVPLLTQRLADEPDAANLFAARTIFDAARMIGTVLREVMAHDGEHVHPHGDPSATFLLGGELQGGRHRLFLIHPAGNFIEAAPETPFLQAGETKYGKPILDRVITYESSLPEAAKCALLSFDATMRSNLSVAPPIDLLCYREGSCAPTSASISPRTTLLQRAARPLRPRHPRVVQAPARPRPDRSERAVMDCCRAPCDHAHQIAPATARSHGWYPSTAVSWPVVASK